LSQEIINAIKERRSVRKFTDEPIDKQILEEIILAGRYAPSARNIQPWRFIVITKPSFIQEISLQIKNEMKKVLKTRFLKKFSYPELKDEEMLKFLYAVAMSPKDIIFFDAPSLVFIVCENGMFFDESCACCAENMMIAAHALGVGSCWIGFASMLGLNKEMLEKIGVPQNHHISAALIFGHPVEANARPPMRKVHADVIQWIS